VVNVSVTMKELMLPEFVHILAVAF